MAASMSLKCWRENIDKQPVCKYLKETFGSKMYQKKSYFESKDILTIHGSDLFVWDFSDSTILHSNLRNVKNQEDEEIKMENLRITEKKGFQKLVLSGSYGFDVESITVNHCCSHILVWGRHGIRIVELPRRWGAGAVFEGGKPVINCRTIVMGERNFYGNRSVTIRQAKWHPGSQTFSHVAVLTSDNVFSVYDMADPDQSFSSIHIDANDSTRVISPSKTFVSSALGEVSVSFDFGSVISLNSKPHMFGKGAVIPTVEVWPVYCVRGNGDVLLLYSHLSSYSSLRLPVHGPLSMYPPAEDNYGVDACYILCLNTPMPILAISTCDGRLHHCVQLNDSPASSDTEQPSSSSPGNSLYEDFPKPILYVIESVELELCLDTVSPLESSGGDEDFFMCPIQLLPDVNSHDRYYCVHKAGVHSVALPWLSVVQQYFLDEAQSLDLSEEKECVVEHLFCTKPLYSCLTAPVLGVDVVSDAALGPTLVILASDFSLTAHAIGVSYQTSSSLPSEKDDNSLSNSSTKHPSTQPFSHCITKILQRKTSNPRIRSSSQIEPSQQECFQLLSRATQILREEYIEKQDHAREEIDTRVAILRDLKENQFEDIKKLKDTTQLLTERVRKKAENLNACSENFDTLRKRLDTILHKLQNRVPNLSEAERDFMKDLRIVQSYLQGYKKNLEGVRTQMEYQLRQKNKGKSVSSPVLQEKQLNQIMSILKEETNEIEDLKKDLTQFSKEMV